jgi:hypothetical protein
MFPAVGFDGVIAVQVCDQFAVYARSVDSAAREAAKIAETNAVPVDRSWEIWKFKALANTSKP